MLWYGDKINYWRDCFEALTSGDFLTADFFGFAFNDMSSDNRPDPNTVRRRLFAISGVSGGAMGAVMVTAALNDAKVDSNDHPCVQVLPFGLWRDRAAVLEDAWDERYQAVVRRADQSAQPMRCKGLNCLVPHVATSARPLDSLARPQWHVRGHRRSHRHDGACPDLPASARGRLPNLRNSANSGPLHTF